MTGQVFADIRRIYQMGRILSPLAPPMDMVGHDKLPVHLINMEGLPVMQYLTLVKRQDLPQQSYKFKHSHHALRQVTRRPHLSCIVNSRSLSGEDSPECMQEPSKEAGMVRVLLGCDLASPRC